MQRGWVAAPAAARRAAAVAAVTLAAAAAVTAGPPAALAATPRLTGADVSSYQHPGGAAVNWDAYARGHAFVFIKATEGANYVNPYFGADWTGSALAGLQHAAYHYARPSLPLSTAATQARYFVQAVRTAQMPGQLPPVLDLEETGGLSRAQLLRWTTRWLTTVRHLVGAAPMIYSYPNFWQTAMGNTTALRGYPLWVASYQRSAPTLFGGWSRHTFWQYDDAGSAAGINSNGTLDVDIFNGSLSDLQALGGGAVFPVNTQLRGYWSSSRGLQGLGSATSPAGRVGGGLTQDFVRGMVFSGAAGLHAIAGPVRDHYRAIGGSSSLGLATADVTSVPGVSGAQAATFQNGRIYWSAATGAWAVSGAVLAHYQGVWGPAALGLPTSDVVAIPGVAGGQVSTFTHGRIYASPVTGAAALTGSVLSRYLSAGGPAALGLPTADVAPVPGFAGVQLGTFEGGRIYSSTASGAHVLSGGILDHYLALGGPTALGLPTTDSVPVSAMPGAQVVTFKGGRIYSGPTTGVFALSGPILSRYLAAGGPANLGLPTSDITPVGGIVGAQMATFQNGRIYWSRATGAHVVAGPVLDHYLALGGPTVVGLPTADAAAVPQVPGGQVVSFTGARIYWSAATGAYELTGPVLSRYLDGRVAATLGLPTSDVVPVPEVVGALTATFGNGRIYWSSTTGGRVVTGSILDRYLTVGGPAVLGLPVGDDGGIRGVPGARTQAFQNGQVFSSPSTGAVDLSGPVLAKYLAAGGAAKLGLPTSPVAAVAGVLGAVTDSFQRGRISWSAATGAHLLTGPVLSGYLAGGGATRLGLPVTDVTGAGKRGSRQAVFQNARIYWSRATGSHVVLGGVLARYLRAGAVSGRLGLPIDDEHAVRAGRAQDFAGGRITWRPNKGATVTYRH